MVTTYEKSTRPEQSWRRPRGDRENERISVIEAYRRK
jgi:hypothetical protein